MIESRERILDFYVPGIPAPEGSLKAILHRTTRRPILIADNPDRLKRWRTAVSKAAHYYMGVKQVGDGAIRIECTFTLPRPASAKRIHPTVKPDLDKLQRAIGDAFKGVVYTDDQQVVDWDVRKRYVGHPEASREGPGVHVVVYRLG